jgi:hypothetical protein
VLRDGYLRLHDAVVDPHVHVVDQALPERATGLDVQTASAPCETRLTGYFTFGPIEVRPDCFSFRLVTLPS